jgi:hypothetical protein
MAEGAPRTSEAEREAEPNGSVFRRGASPLRSARTIAAAPMRYRAPDFSSVSR